MTLLMFERGRLDSLRLALGAAVDDLRAIRNGDYDAADVMRALAGCCRTLEETWLPRVYDVLNSTAMTSCTRSAPGAPDVSQSAAKLAIIARDGWEVVPDPLGGPPPPRRVLNGDEVMKAINSGALRPLAPPLDAEGRANAHYESIAFAPITPPREIGRVDLTSNAAKIIDFFSDGLPIGWHESSTLIIFRVDDVRVTKSVHALTAYDPDDGPETLTDQTTEAITSGYIAVAVNQSLAEVTLAIGYGDPTAAYAIASQTTSGFSGAFFPDRGSEPEFEPIPDEVRVESPDQWTFTKSASPMVDGWGTWQA